MMTNSMSNWVSNSVSIGSNTIVGNISNIAIIVIGMIVDMLSTTIRKVDGVRALHNTGTIIGFSLAESSTGVVISNSIGVRVGRGLSMVCNNWGMVDKRSMGNSNWVSYGMTKSMSKAKSNSMVKTMTKELRSSRSCGDESSKTGERLHVVVLCSLIK